MAIDADLGAGLITDKEARARRAEHPARSRLLRRHGRRVEVRAGRRDRGLLIVAVNLVGGIIIGVAQKGMSLGHAAQTYTLLSIGDGLVAQIPALLISIATGLIVTRAGSGPRARQRHLGQVLKQRTARSSHRRDRPLRAHRGPAQARDSAVAGIFAAVGWATVKDPPPDAGPDRRRTGGAAAPGADPLSEVGVDAIELAIGFGLIPLVDSVSGGTILLRVSRSAATSRAISGSWCLPFGFATSSTSRRTVRSQGTRLEVRAAASWPANCSRWTPTRERPIAGDPDTRTRLRIPAVWVRDIRRAEAESLGYTVIDVESVIVTHLTERSRPRTGSARTSGSIGAARQDQGDQCSGG